MRLLKIIAIIGIVGLVIGFIHFAFFRPAEVPRLKVVAELAKTQYQVGEEISVKPHLINMGKRSITVFSGKPFLFAKVYDAENRQVLRLPVWPSLPILAKYTLSPNVPYEEVYTFVLEQPGRYKIEAWAELSFDERFAYPVHIYADPIWIEVVTGSN